MKGQVFTMPTDTRGLKRALAALVAAVGVLGFGYAVIDLPAAAPLGAPCYNGIAPFNPYVDNCAIPQRPPHIIGAAPDQTAILNCSFGSGVWRAICLSQYVNGGPYAGIGIG